MTIGLISFSCSSPAASWAPSVNPRRGGGYAQGEEHYQTQDFAGNDFYSYDQGGPPNTRLLEWSLLPAADMATLLAFMAAMKGGRYKFSFTDYDSTVFTVCRILNFQAFPFTHRTLTHYEVSLEIEVE